VIVCDVSVPETYCVTVLDDDKVDASITTDDTLVIPPVLPLLPIVVAVEVAVGLVAVVDKTKSALKTILLVPLLPITAREGVVVVTGVHFGFCELGGHQVHQKNEVAPSSQFKYPSGHAMGKVDPSMQ
jgi:hypothetical protein